MDNLYKSFNKMNNKVIYAFLVVIIILQLYCIFKYSKEKFGPILDNICDIRTDPSNIDCSSPEGQQQAVKLCMNRVSQGGNKRIISACSNPDVEIRRNACQDSCEIEDVPYYLKQSGSVSKAEADAEKKFREGGNASEEHDVTFTNADGEQQVSAALSEAKYEVGSSGISQFPLSFYSCDAKGRDYLSKMGASPDSITMMCTPCDFTQDYSLQQHCYNPQKTL